MRCHLAPALAITVLSLFSAASFGGSSSARTQQQTRPKNVNPLKTPVAPQGAEGGFWRTDFSFQATLVLKNSLETLPMSVTPVLFMADGTEYPLNDVQLEPSGTAVLNINSALQNAPPNIQSHISTHGSAAIRFQWHWAAAVLASIQNIDEPRSFVYTMPLQADIVKTHDPAAKRSSQLIDSMWWKIEPSVGGFLALTNTSLNTLSATVSVSNSDSTASVPRTVSVPSHNTVMLDLASILDQLPRGSSEGGISIAYSGGHDALVVHGGLEDPSTGYSQKLGFFPKEIAAPDAPPPSPKAMAVSSPGIMVGIQEADMQFPKGTSFTPYVVLRNATSQAMQVGLAANFLKASAPTDVPLGSITLAPQTVQQIDVQRMLRALGLDKLNGYLNLQISFTGSAGDILIATGSIDQTQSFVFEVPPSKNGRSNAKSFCYWNTTGDTDTMLTVWNQSEKDQDLILTFFHREGEYDFPFHLGANVSMTMNFSTIIRQGLPDARGNVIPSNITEGSAKLSGAKGDQEVLKVSTNISIFNVRTATCSAPCAHCIGVAGDPYTRPDSVTVGVRHDSGYVHAYLLYDNVQEKDETDHLIWGIDDPDIASEDGSYPVVTGKSPGSTLLLGYPDPTEFPEGMVTGDGVYNCHDYGDGWGCDMFDPEWVLGVTVPTPSTFEIAYSAYIPFDNMFGPTTCNYPTSNGSAVQLLYMGDANRGTYRATESELLTPDTLQSSGFYQNTGVTRNYGFGSPVTSTLSSADEDGVPYDCFLWNNAAQAIPGYSHSESFGNHTGQIQLSGAAANPLEDQSATITWNMTTVIETTDLQSPTGYVSYSHTCYPAHQIKVGGQVIYLYTPTRSDLDYVTGCLLFHVGTVSGQTNSTSVQPQ